MLHSPFGPCLVPDFLHTVIAACVAISGGPKSRNTESGATKLAAVYQMPIYNMACAVLRKEYYAFWRNGATTIWKLRAYASFYRPFRTAVGEVSSEAHRNLNIRNGVPHVHLLRRSEIRKAGFLDIMRFFLRIRSRLALLYGIFRWRLDGDY